LEAIKLDFDAATFLVLKCSGRIIYRSISMDLRIEFMEPKTEFMRRQEEEWRWEDEMTAALARGDLEAAKVAAQKHAKAYHRTMAVIGVKRYSDFD
jgi:hypothetical protein